MFNDLRKSDSLKKAIYWFVGVFVLLLPVWLFSDFIFRNQTDAIIYMNNVWQEVRWWRVVLMEETNHQGEWPRDVASLDLNSERSRIWVTSPAPYKLIVTIKNRKEAGALSGKKMLLEFNPATFEFLCSQGEPPIPSRYLSLGCGVDQWASDQVRMGYMLLVLLLFSIIVALVFFFFRPVLVAIQREPKKLFKTSYLLLPKIDRTLRLIGRHSSVLLEAGITGSYWRKALHYVEAPPWEKVEMLVMQVGGTCRPCTDWALPGLVYEWCFPVEVSIGLERCLVYVPVGAQSEEVILQSLRSVQTGQDVMLVVMREDMDRVQQYCADRTNLYVAICAEAQTEWLLSRDAPKILLREMAAQLYLTRISPYQTRGGVVKEGAFFGRTQILARMLNREPANYLVVGGRQLGKTSLLKAMQRHLREHPSILCHYVSLRDHRLAPRLALQFGLDAQTPLEEVIEHVISRYADKRLFFLVDEADLFFRDESKHDYRQLSALRTLSEEGRCWFVLAGFWDLYVTAVLDYQSPLRNFGEVIAIGGLEIEACHELATVPLSRLGVRFAHKALVEQLVEMSGQRANLIAMVCQECLEVLPPEERIITKRYLQQAFKSQAVQDVLAGWGRLSQDENASRLDRIIVYYVALYGQIRLSDVLALFAQREVKVDIVLVQHAFSRLTLAYVLKMEAGIYRFVIPLFMHQFEMNELDLLLQHELDFLADKAIDSLR